MFASKVRRLNLEKSLARGGYPGRLLGE